MAKVSVETRDRSIRLRFTWQGEPQRPTLRTDAGQPMLPTAANLKYASKLAAEIERHINNDTFTLADYFADEGAHGALTLAHHLDVWLATQRLAPSTLKGYGSAIKFWKGTTYEINGTQPLGEKPMRAITITDLKTALALRPKLSGKTINNYVSVLNEAYLLAVAEKIVERNLVADIGRAKWQKKPADPFTREETEAIIADMHKHYPSTVANMVEWWFFSGVRTGEAFGLRWANVDLRSGRALISESIVLGEERDSTKTGVARNIILNSRALGAIQRQRAVSQMAGGHVWTHPFDNLGWTDERAFRRSYWEPTLKRTGIRYRRPYTMRHTFATMMLMAGRTPAWCAKQLGHSIEMFLGTYSKWIDGDQDARELAGLESWLGEGNSKERAS